VVEVQVVLVQLEGLMVQILYLAQSLPQVAVAVDQEMALKEQVPLAVQEVLEAV
jgi:hypothetical protein